MDITYVALEILKCFMNIFLWFNAINMIFTLASCRVKIIWRSKINNSGSTTAFCDSF